MAPEPEFFEPLKATWSESSTTFTISSLWTGCQVGPAWRLTG